MTDETSKYKLIIEGKLKTGYQMEPVVKLLARFLNKDPSKIFEIFFNGNPTVIKKGLKEKEALEFRDRLRKLGIICRMEKDMPEATLDEMTQPPPLPEPPAEACPKCGHVPKPQQISAVLRGECPACGVIFDKYRKAEKKSPPSTVLPSPKPSKKSWAETLGQIAICLILFGVFNFFTACSVGLFDKLVIVDELPPNGGIVGPLEVKSEKEIYKIRMSQPITRSGLWSAVSCEVLDQNKNSLFGFGDEFWMETGRDSEGPWTESKTRSSINVTLEKGTYYLNFEGEQAPGVNNKIKVEVKKLFSSRILFVLIGILAVCLGIFLAVVANIGKSL